METILDKIHAGSIQRKLLLLIGAAVVVSLVLVIVGILGYEIATYRNRLVREVSELGGFLAANSAPTLAFDDPKTAGDILATLEGSPTIASAALYLADGRVFASYVRSDQPPDSFPTVPGPPRLEQGIRDLVLVRPVAQKGLPLGTLYLHADMASLYPRLGNYVGIVFLISAAFVAGAFLLQRLLQRLVTEPLLELSGMAERIAGGDLTAAVPVRSGDEIGRLAAAFNRMTTELEQSYRELRESRARLAGIVETAMDAIITVDSERRILLFNAAAERMFGCLASEAVGERIDRFILMPFEAGATGETAVGELAGVRQDGEKIPLEASLSALEAEGGRLVTVILRDISGRKEAEDALRASELRLRRAEQMAHFGYWRYDAGEDHLSWSEESYRIHGVSPEEYRPTLAGYLHFVHPEDRDRYQESMRKGEIDFQYRIVRPNGALRYLTVTGEVQWEPDGETADIFGTYLDTTELRQAERELQEKNAELERFTYTVSHDLKSPLVTVKTFLGYLVQDMEAADSGRIEKDMLYIRNAAEKMGLLLDELLEMSRIGRMINPPVRVTFREVVQEALLTVAGSIAEREVEVGVQDDVVLYGDRPRLVEVWQNLVENAVKFMGEQESPRIEIGLERVRGEPVFFVRDNGVGFDPRYAEKVFGLFEKLDPRSKGTGLGLALVRRIVQLYQGRVWAESAGVGQGACFRFTLPTALKPGTVDMEGE